MRVDMHQVTLDVEHELTPNFRPGFLNSFYPAIWNIYREIWRSKDAVPLPQPAVHSASAPAADGLAMDVADGDAVRHEVEGSAPAPAAEPYSGLEEVDSAMKSDGLSLWLQDYPDTTQGNINLKEALQQPQHALKLSRFAATTCELFGFSARVVECAKSIVAARHAHGHATAVAGITANLQNLVEGVRELQDEVGVSKGRSTPLVDEPPPGDEEPQPTTDVADEPVRAGKRPSKKNIKGFLVPSCVGAFQPMARSHRICLCMQIRLIPRRTLCCWICRGGASFTRGLGDSSERR